MSGQQKFKEEPEDASVRLGSVVTLRYVFTFYSRHDNIHKTLSGHYKLLDIENIIKHNTCNNKQIQDMAQLDLHEGMFLHPPAVPMFFYYFTAKHRV